jgi:hypothetical protein
MVQYIGTSKYYQPGNKKLQKGKAFAVHLPDLRVSWARVRFGVLRLLLKAGDELREYILLVSLETILLLDDRVAGRSASHLSACADFELKTAKQCARTPMENHAQV